MNKALNLAEEQSEDGWRPVMGRFWMAEAGVGCRRLRTCLISFHIVFVSSVKMYKFGIQEFERIRELRNILRYTS